MSTCATYLYTDNGIWNIQNCIFVRLFSEQVKLHTWGKFPCLFKCSACSKYLCYLINPYSIKHTDISIVASLSHSKVNQERANLANLLWDPPHFVTRVRIEV